VVDLAALQQAFTDALTARSIDAVSVSAFSGSPERVWRRLGFYRGNVQANARKALRNAYPICALLVGDEFFDGMACEHAARMPSSSGDLNDYGAEFATFVEDFVPARSVPYLADVARLEWQVHRAHYAADASPFDPARLAAVPHDRFGELRIALHPACALVESNWPLPRLWDVHQPGYAGAFDVDFDAGPHRALVHRPAFRVKVTALDAASFAFLSRATAGDSIAAALASARAVDACFTLDAGLRQWVAGRVIVDLTLS
jgi:hypothetical protein